MLASCRNCSIPGFYMMTTMVVDELNKKPNQYKLHHYHLNFNNPKVFLGNLSKNKTQRTFPKTFYLIVSTETSNQECCHLDIRPLLCKGFLSVILFCSFIMRNLVFIIFITFGIIPFTEGFRVWDLHPSLATINTWHFSSFNKNSQ